MENKILATVEGIEITQANVDSFIQGLGPQQAAQFQNEEGKKHILQELINQNLFLADAKANKVNETNEFKVELAKMTEVILTQVNINNLVNSIEVEDKEVKEYFESNKAKFSSPAKADTSHILVETEEECQEIHAKISNNEISFEEAAQAHSKCPSKDNGGKLGSYPKGQMVPEYDAVAFNLKKEEISNPVKTQFGYHIIRLKEKQDATEVKFEDVKQQAKNQLLSTKQRETYTNKVNEMRETYNVEMA